MYGGYEGAASHIAYVTIPGATIPVLEFAWRIDYRHEIRPMDVLLVSGLNDVKSETEDEIMHRFENFAATVMGQSDKYHPENPSTVSIATLIYPPLFTWFPGREPAAGSSKENKLEKMKSINGKIMELNQKLFEREVKTYKRLNDGVAGTQNKAPRFHKYGLRKVTRKYPNGKKVPVTTHRFEHWRQSEPRDRMLHLNNEQRAKMGRAVSAFFKCQFEPSD